MTSTTTPFLACVVQEAPVYLDLAQSVDKARRLIAQAASQGARLIAFPEVWLPGYPWWVWLDEPQWANRLGWSQRYRQQAVDFNGPEVQALAECAATHHIHVVMGAAEREDERLYISQWLFDDQGRVRLKRRKLKPGPLELRVFSEGGPDDLPVVDTALGRVGALACAEHRHPLLKHALHLQGELAHVAAWPSFALDHLPGMLSSQTFLAVSRTYAVEGACYVLAPCAPLPADVAQALCDTPEKAQRLRAGGGHAQIFAPNGDPLCEPLAPDQEGLLYATIDPARAAAARQAFDLAGHSARADVVRLVGPSALPPATPARTAAS